MQRNLVAPSFVLLENIRSLSIFKGIPTQVLQTCLTRVDEVHLLKGEVIFRRGESYHKGIYFILTGSVRMITHTDGVNVNAGNALGISTFLGKTMYSLTAVANTDCHIVFIDEYSIYGLMDKAPEFREKFMRVIVDRLSSLERMDNKNLSISVSQSVGGCMSSPIVTLHNSKSVAEAARTMAEHNVNAILIINRKHNMKGLLTARHLVHKYLSQTAEPPEAALAENFADPNPLMLPQEYPLGETLSEMLHRGEDYALVTRKNKPVGIVSKAEIMNMLNRSSDVFYTSVAETKDIDALKSVVDTLPKIVENMMNNTSLFRELLPIISTHHFIVQKRTFELAKQAYRKLHPNFDIPADKYCFISVGNLAGREMTLEMRQNHIMALANDVSKTDVAHYQALGKLFADKLFTLGYKYSQFGLSLENPDMVKRVSEWQEFISASIHKSNDTNIPVTRVLFDCGRFEGDETLLWDFKDAIYATIKEKMLLFSRLLTYQSAAKIPVSEFGSFITDKDGGIDLKENALDFIRYTAQALALSQDLLDMNTIRRIERLGRDRVISEELMRETISAYESIVNLILHEQLSSFNEGHPPSFRIYPANLSVHAQDMLKRSLHVAARFFGTSVRLY